MVPAAERRRWFRLSSGETADLFTLRDPGGLTAAIGNFGATLVSLRVPDRDGEPGDIVLGFADPAAYERNLPYFGSTIGRFANRIRDGRFDLEGRLYELAVNAAPHHLHGGRSGFSHRLWEAETVSEPARAGVLLRLRSPDGDESYPGALDVVVTYWLEAGGRLRIEYSARTDAPTHVNLTHHSYFNLAGRGDILDHRLEVRARRYTPIDETGIPTGEVADVAGTPLDFTTPKAVGSRIEDDFAQLKRAGGYDHNFVIDGWDGSLRPCARVEDPFSGRVMTVETTCPGVQLYTANSLAHDGGRNGGPYGPRQGLCLETQFFPDTPNQPHFPSTRLDPGEEWRQTTVYGFVATGRAGRDDGSG